MMQIGLIHAFKNYRLNLGYPAFSMIVIIIIIIKNLLTLAMRIYNQLEFIDCTNEPCINGCAYQVIEPSDFWLTLDI